LFLGASVIVMEGLTDPEQVEAVACKEGLALAILEIQARGREFETVSFVHENRLCNFDAHRLARSSISRSCGRHLWLIRPPDGMCNSIPAD
ncbi:hypothetical protein BAE44_0023233, partial [Dichanthelium oligosanthes]